MEVLNTFIDYSEGNPLKKSFEWRTDLVGFDSGVEQRNKIWTAPRRHWFLNWPMLNKATRDKLIELFQRAHGRYDTFLYQDSDDYECALAECSITAVAAQVLFQLKKSYYYDKADETWDENKKDIQPSSIFAPVIKVDGAAKSEWVDFTLDDSTGIVDFTLMGAPGADAVITANYYFYFRVRFNFDTHIDIMDEAALYSAKGLEIVEVKS